MHFLHIALSLQLPFLEGISDMPGNHRLVAPEKLHHLRLRQPDGISLQAHVEPDDAIRGLIDFDLAQISPHLSPFCSPYITPSNSSSTPSRKRLCNNTCRYSVRSGVSLSRAISGPWRYSQPVS